MSHELAKEKHSKRIQEKINHIRKQLKIRHAHSIGVNGMSVGDKYDEPHRYHKRSGMTCGDSNCVMCGNPRKFWKERTIQEKSFIQTEKWATD